MKNQLTRRERRRFNREKARRVRELAEQMDRARKRGSGAPQEAHVWIGVVLVLLFVVAAIGVIVSCSPATPQ